MTETPSDDERPIEETPAEEQPSAEEPAPEPTAEAAEEAPGEQQPVAEAEAAADAAGAEDAPEEPEEEGGEPPPAEEALAEDAATGPDEAPAKPAASKPKDAVPGADLEPIAISEERELTAEERARAEAEAEERAAREATAADVEEEEAIAPRTVSIPADAQVQATGKRKSAVARVIVRSGSGSFQINDRPLEQYFPSTQHQSLARQPLVASGYDGSVDVRVRVHGGGISGQAGAVRHGVARALTGLEPELRPELKRRGMLTRDDRRKERKKAGLKKARKRPQFSKR